MFTSLLTHASICSWGICQVNCKFCRLNFFGITFLFGTTSLSHVCVVTQTTFQWSLGESKCKVKLLLPCSCFCVMILNSMTSSATLGKGTFNMICSRKVTLGCEQEESVQRCYKIFINIGPARKPLISHGYSPNCQTWVKSLSYVALIHERTGKSSEFGDAYKRVLFAINHGKSEQLFPAFTPGETVISSRAREGIGVKKFDSHPLHVT